MQLKQKPIFIVSKFIHRQLSWKFLLLGLTRYFIKINSSTLNMATHKQIRHATQEFTYPFPLHFSFGFLMLTTDQQFPDVARSFVKKFMWIICFFLNCTRSLTVCHIGY